MFFNLLSSRSYIFIIFFIILLISGCQEGGSVTGSNDLSEDGFGSIAGKLVIDRGIVSDTGQFISLGGSVLPASDISVKLMTTNAEIQTDSLGNYLFEKVPEGKHSLVADAGEYKLYIQNIEVRTGEISKNVTGTLAVCGSVKGTVRLAGQSDHDRIEVTLPYSKKTYYTNVTGDYIYENLPAGTFTIVFSKYGFETSEKTVIIDPGKTFQMEDIILFPTQNQILKSDFTGALEKDSIMTKQNSPYTPTGDITVPHGIELIIEPGVEIIFPDNADSTSSGFFSGKSQTSVITQSEKLSELMVQGSLSVLGSISEIVSIRSESNISGTWGGIYFSAESSDNKCVILNCSISSSNCGIICNDSSPELMNVNISNILNYGIGINGSSSNPLVENIMISNCSRGIYLKQGGAVVKNSVITGSNASGIVIEDSSFSLFENSIISNNSGGIEISGSNSVRIFDSIIGGNRYGILASNSNSVQIKNNVVVSNSEYGIKADESVQIQYNNVYGNQSSGNTSKIPDGGNYMSVQSGYGDIQVAPNFVKADFDSPDKGDWNLNADSLLTGAGIDGRNIGLSRPDYTGIEEKVFLMTDKNRILRAFPQIAVLLEDDEIKFFKSRLSSDLISRLVKETVHSLKQEVINDCYNINDNYEARIKSEIFKRFSILAIQLTDLNYKRVINLSGIVMHSNLGRAVLPEKAVESIVKCATGPVNLEMDMITGKRIDRNLIVRQKINFLFGAEDSIIVNNNAAALLIICNSFSKGRDILVSRGELVAIGGSFRLHEIIEASGARVKAIGTTNRTTASDYEAAIDSETAMILKIHPSNFYMRGYVHNTELHELGKIASENDIRLCYDMGTAVTGVFFKNKKYDPERAFNEGADIVSFSGDKLLCGPQSGIILGRSDDIRTLHQNPMFRALRCCKLTLTAFETVLSEYIRDPETSPLIKILSQSLTKVLSTAEKLKNHFLDNLPKSFSVSIDSGHTLIGSGVSPEIKYDTYILTVTSTDYSLNKISELFRNHKTPVVGYINNEKFCLDCRQIDFDITEIFNKEFFNLFK